MKKEQVTLNGIFLWYKMGMTTVFARQIEPSEWLKDERDKIQTQILVGFEGSQGEDLIDVLNERETLKKRVEELEHKRNDDMLNNIENLTNRICNLEKKRWWQFWE